MDSISRESTGTVHLTMPGRGGIVDTAGITLPPWIETFLSDPARSDTIRKLHRGLVYASSPSAARDHEYPRRSGHRHSLSARSTARLA